MDVRRWRWVLAGLVVGLVVLQWVPFLATYASTWDPALVPADKVEHFQEAEHYQRARDLSGLGYGLVGFPVLALVLLSGVAIRLDNRGGPLARWGWRVLFMAGLYGILLLSGLPNLLATFLVRRSLGLTHLTLDARMHFLLLGNVVPLVLFLMDAVMTYCCFAIFGRRWWLWAALLGMLVFSVIPEWVSRTRPLDPVATLTRMPEGAHREALDAVAALAGMEEMDYYFVDQSKRSAMVNMYLTGRIGREYAVVTDTLANLLEPRELAVVMAHELGHQVTRTFTVVCNKVTGLTFGVLGLWLVACVYRRRAIDHPHRLQALVWIILVVELIGWVVGPLSCAVNRYQEREADYYALELTGDKAALESALLKMAEANYGSVDLPSWAYWLGGTHPTLKQRLTYTRAWEPSPPIPEAPRGP